MLRGGAKTAGSICGFPLPVLSLFQSPELTIDLAGVISTCNDGTLIHCNLQGSDIRHEL